MLSKQTIEGQGLPPLYVRLTSIDYYMAPPVPGLDVCFSFFEGTVIQQVPIIRIFGSTPAGQKTCIHLHKAFPYFYVPYDDDMPAQPHEAAAWLRSMARSLENSIQYAGSAQQAPAGAGAAAGGQANEHQQHNDGSRVQKRQIVHNLQLVKARPFYGYHPDEKLFIKVVLYNPHDITKASQLLGSGVIMGRRMQPHESHIPFLLQVKIDFNLLGMGHVKLRRALFRDPIPPCAPLPRPGWDVKSCQQIYSAAVTRPGQLEVQYDAAGVLPMEGLQNTQQASQQGTQQNQPRALFQTQSQRPQQLQFMPTLNATPGKSNVTPTTPGLTAVQTQQQVNLTWTERSVPRQYRWSDKAQGGGRVPARQTLCELEVDVSVEDLINRQEAVRVPLEDADEEQHLVESLVPMWEEERERCGGQLPPRPESPPRQPQILCAAVEAVRTDLQGVAVQIADYMAQIRKAEQTSPTTTTVDSPSVGVVGLGSDSQDWLARGNIDLPSQKLRGLQPQRPSQPTSQQPGPEQGPQNASRFQQQPAAVGLSTHMNGAASQLNATPKQAGRPVTQGDNHDAIVATGHPLLAFTQAANQMTGAGCEAAPQSTAQALAAAVGQLHAAHTQQDLQVTQPGSQSSPFGAVQRGYHTDGANNTAFSQEEPDATPEQAGIEPNLSQRHHSAMLTQLPSASLPYGLTQLADAATQQPPSQAFGLTQLAEAANTAHERSSQQRVVGQDTPLPIQQLFGTPYPNSQPGLRDIAASIRNASHQPLHTDTSLPSLQGTGVGQDFALFSNPSQKLPGTTPSQMHMEGRGDMPPNTAIADNAELTRQQAARGYSQDAEHIQQPSQLGSQYVQHGNLKSVAPAHDVPETQQGMLARATAALATPWLIPATQLGMTGSQRNYNHEPNSQPARGIPMTPAVLLNRLNEIAIPGTASQAQPEDDIVHQQEVFTHTSMTRSSSDVTVCSSENGNDSVPGSVERSEPSSVEASDEDVQEHGSTRYHQRKRRSGQGKQHEHFHSGPTSRQESLSPVREQQQYTNRQHRTSQSGVGRSDAPSPSALGNDCIEYTDEHDTGMLAATAAEVIMDVLKDHDDASQRDSMDEDMSMDGTQETPERSRRGDEDVTSERALDEALGSMGDDGGLLRQERDQQREGDRVSGMSPGNQKGQAALAFETSPEALMPPQGWHLYDVEGSPAHQPQLQADATNNRRADAYELNPDMRHTPDNRASAGVQARMELGHESPTRNTTNMLTIHDILGNSQDSFQQQAQQQASIATATPSEARDGFVEGPLPQGIDYGLSSFYDSGPVAPIPVHRAEITPQSQFRHRSVMPRDPFEDAIEDIDEHPVLSPHLHTAITSVRNASQEPALTPNSSSQRIHGRGQRSRVPALRVQPLQQRSPTPPAQPAPGQATDQPYRATHTMLSSLLGPNSPQTSTTPQKVTLVRHAQLITTAGGQEAHALDTSYNRIAGQGNQSRPGASTPPHSFPQQNIMLGGQQQRQSPGLMQTPNSNQRSGQSKSPVPLVSAWDQYQQRQQPQPQLQADNQLLRRGMFVDQQHIANADTVDHHSKADTPYIPQTDGAGDVDGDDSLLNTMGASIARNTNSSLKGRFELKSGRSITRRQKNSITSNNSAPPSNLQVRLQDSKTAMATEMEVEVNKPVPNPTAAPARAVLPLPSKRLTVLGLVPEHLAKPHPSVSKAYKCPVPRALQQQECSEHSSGHDKCGTAGGSSAKTEPAKLGAAASVDQAAVMNDDNQMDHTARPRDEGIAAGARASCPEHEGLTSTAAHEQNVSFDVPADGNAGTVAAEIPTVEMCTGDHSISQTSQSPTPADASCSAKRRTTADDLEPPYPKRSTPNDTLDQCGAGSPLPPSTVTNFELQGAAQMEGTTTPDKVTECSHAKHTPAADHVDDTLQQQQQQQQLPACIETEQQLHILEHAAMTGRLLQDTEVPDADSATVVLQSSSQQSLNDVSLATTVAESEVNVDAPCSKATALVESPIATHPITTWDLQEHTDIGNGQAPVDMQGLEGAASVMITQQPTAGNTKQQEAAMVLEVAAQSQPGSLQCQSPASGLQESVHALQPTTVSTMAGSSLKEPCFIVDTQPVSHSVSLLRQAVPETQLQVPIQGVAVAAQNTTHEHSQPHTVGDTVGQVFPKDNGLVNTIDMAPATGSVMQDISQQVKSQHQATVVDITQPVSSTRPLAFADNQSGTQQQPLTNPGAHVHSTTTSPMDSSPHQNSQLVLRSTQPEISNQLNTHPAPNNANQLASQTTSHQPVPQFQPTQSGGGPTTNTCGTSAQDQSIDINHAQPINATDQDQRSIKPSQETGARNSQRTNQQNLHLPHPPIPSEPNTRQDAMDVDVLWFRPLVKPPTSENLAATWHHYGLGPVVHQDPFYSAREDVPPRPIVFASREWRIPCADDVPLFSAAFLTAPSLQLTSNAHHDGTDHALGASQGPPPAVEDSDGADGAAAHANIQRVVEDGIPRAGNQPTNSSHTSCLQKLLNKAKALLGGPQAAATAAAIIQQQLLSRNRLGFARPAGFCFKPLQPPPSSKIVTSWLHQQQVKARHSKQVIHNTAPAAPSFAMDPNTGALLPITGNHPTTTPAVHKHTAARLPANPMGIFGLPAHSTQHDYSGADYAGGAASLLATPEVPGSELRGDHSRRQGDAQDQQPATIGDEPDIMNAPPSPKYDERTTFFFTGAAGMRAPTTTPAAPGLHALQGLEDGEFDVGGLPIGSPPSPAAEHEVQAHTTQRPNARIHGNSLQPTQVMRSMQHPGQTPSSSQANEKPAGGNQVQLQHSHAEQGVRVEAVEQATPAVPVAHQNTGIAPGTPSVRGGQPLSLFSPVMKPSHQPPPTPSSQRGFKRADPGRGEQLTLACVEIIADVRGGLLPDPRHDALRAVILVVWEDGADAGNGRGFTSHILMRDVLPTPTTAKQNDMQRNHDAATAGAGNTADSTPNVGGNPGQDANPAAAHNGPGTFADVVRMPGMQDLAQQEPLQEQPLQQQHDPPGAQQANLQPEQVGCKSMSGPGTSSLGRAVDAWAEYLLPFEVPGGNISHVDGLNGCEVEVFEDEAALLAAVTWRLQALDPDILLGWDLQRGSLGWLAERAAHLGTNLLRSISRTPGQAGLREAQNDEYGQLHASGLHSTGRILLNLWRIIRGEVKLNMYSFESCCAAVLRKRVPCISHTQLAAWFVAGPAAGRWRALRAMTQRCVLCLLMVDTLDLVGRTAEMARAFGIDFFSVLTRGSQYRVESLLVRLAHTQNYLMISPSREQVGGQPAMEAIPLVMEPESRMYTSPVVVLDFQSLYPSQMIAYNLCYSTCVGRVAHARAAAAVAAEKARNIAARSTQQQSQGNAGAGQQLHADMPLSHTGIRLGSATYLPPHEELVPKGPLDPANLIISPNGIAYTSPTTRPGVLPRMLREILETRLLAKSGMKRHAADRVLQRILNARQFGLKMISNVTYGYTSAGFSGRMPFAELADSIVQSGRQTLENAIKQVEEHPDWRARVVYGDTDSMFVLLPGRTREEAFRIGNEIAAAITAANPPPVTLRLDKVYHPCILQTKKRYVGFMYESAAQQVPTFDAKGIETVRRDSCPAVSKLLEASLRLLFATKDLSQVKDYLIRQWTKILTGRVSLQDFMFAKEVRLGTYSAAAATIPPAAVVAARAMAADPRAEPRFAERVPYVVVAGPPRARLVDLVVEPHVLVESGGRLRLNALYYIVKQIIPALERVLSLVGADVRAWFAAMPRATRMLPQKRPASSLGLGPPTTGVSNPALPISAQMLGHAGVPPWQMHATGSGTATAFLGSSTIDQFYLSRHCAVCDGLTRPSRPLCDECTSQPQMAIAVLQARISRLERQHRHMVRICLHCGGGGGTLAQGQLSTRGATSNAAGNGHPRVLAGQLPGSRIQTRAGVICNANGVGGYFAHSCHTDGGVICNSLDCGVYFERRKLSYELAALGALAVRGDAFL